MSYYAPLSKFVDSSETNVAPGAVIVAEGQALVRVPGAISAGVQPSMAATANEQFVGFSIAGTSAAPFPEGFLNKVETLVVPPTGIVELQFAPVPGQTFVYDNTTDEAVASPTVTGKQVSGLTEGDSVTVTYKYQLTVVQARAVFGDVQPGGYSGAYIGQIGVVKRGQLYTSEFNASVDWSAATAIKLAPNGQITDQSGTGAVINGFVFALPTQEVPFLGIEFSAP